jgi:DNA-binding transcriptional regulator YbjK
MTGVPRPPTERARLAEAATELISREGLRGLSWAAVDRAAQVPDGTTARVFADLDALVLAVNDHLVASAAAAWLGVGPAAPETVEELAERFAQYAVTQAGRHAAQTRARVELMLAHPDVLTVGHLALREMITVMLDRLGMPDPGSRADMLIDGTVIRHCSEQREVPQDEQALTRAIKRVVT